MKVTTSLAARAKATGQTPAAFAEGNIHADGTVGKLARIYYYSMGGGVHGSGGANMQVGGDRRRTLGETLYQCG